MLTIGAPLLWSSCSMAEKDANGSYRDIDHVIVIGFDGLSPDGLQNASTPNFDRLMNEGSYTMHARAVMPTSSSPNWASMIMGAGPEQHGIMSNAWERDNLILPAVVQHNDFLFPTIFHLVDKQIANAEIGAIYHWGGFGRLFEKDAVDFDQNTVTEEETASVASTYIIEKKPNFTFVHFDHVDHAGHEFGHGTSEYYASVERADMLLGQVLQAVHTAGIADRTLIIISADHGGLGKGHGGETLSEIEIPFIIWGKPIKQNYKLLHPVYQYDNAATVAFALGVRTPEAWIGRPVKNAFKGFESVDAYQFRELLKEPVIYPKAEGYKKAGGLFDEEVTVVIENPNTRGELRYTLDGTMPSSSSELTTGSIKINTNVVLKSAVFNAGKMNSLVAESYFRIKPKNSKKPIHYELFYLQNLSNIPSLASRIPDATGACFEIGSAEIKDLIKEHTVVRFRTKMKIDQVDTYTFFLRSDDGSKLLVDGQVVVDNDGDHGVKEADGKIELQSGEHDLEVIWFNGGGGSWLDVYIESLNMPKQILPTTLLNS